MASRRDAKKTQQDFFANMQTLFLGNGTNGAEATHGEAGGIVGQLKAAADDLRAAADMMRQNTMAQPNYGGPNGNRPTMSWNQTKRPEPTDYGHQYAGYGSFRRTLATEIGARYGSDGGILRRGNTLRAHYDQQGKIDYYDEIGPDGRATGNVHHASYQPAAQQYARQQNAQRVSNAIANAPAQSTSVLGSDGTVHSPGVSAVTSFVNDTVGKIPVVGGAIAGLVTGLIGLPDAIMNGIVNQRAANAQYQSILGGTNWSTGVHNRWLEQGFTLSQLYSGGLTGTMSQEAFRGVTALGYTGTARDQSLGLITSNYKNLGMSVSDSLKLVATMAQSSSTSFEALKTILNEVGNAAQSTGQNLELARANLTSLFGIATSAIGGQGSLQTSGLLSAYQAQLGRNFASVDFSQMLPGVNPGLTALQASSVGMTMNQYELMQAGGGAAARQLQETAGNNLMAMSVAPTVSIVKPIVNQLMQQAGGLHKVTASNDSWQSFVQSVMRNPKFINSGINIMALKAQIKAYTGATMNDQQAVEWLLRQTTGVGASLHSVDKQQQHSMLQSHVHKMVTTHESWGGKAPGSITKHHMENITVDPILSRFNQHFNNDSTHMIVQTAQGPKVVTGSYAYAHLQDQIAKGTAKFVGGVNDGKSVKDVVGGGYAESNYKGADTYKTSGKDAKNFHSVSAWEKAHPNTVNGSGGKVIIAPNPALAQLLSITATGNLTVANESAQYGSIPRPGQTGLYMGQ